jgi:hypothetical protein
MSGSEVIVIACKIALVLVKHHLQSCLHLLLFVRFVQHLTFR